MSNYSVGVGTSGEILLRDREASSSVQIAPARGGLIKRFCVRQREVLYLDEATFEDRQKNVRGGVPILFPSPGRLAGDRFAVDGVEGALPQHGFARQREFAVRELDAERGEVTLHTAWEVSEAYPWAGALDLRVRLRGALLRVETSVHNHSATPMPYALGFHPYFAVPQANKGQVRVAHHAEQAFDNVRKSEVRVGKSLDFEADELDLHLLDHPSSSLAVFQREKLLLTLRASEDFGVWVLWTLRDKDFLCVEPWTAAANALNTGERLQRVAPGAARQSWVEIEVAS